MTKRFMSWVALNRIMEREKATSVKFLRQLGGRPSRAHAKSLSDEELLAKLRSFGLDLDRSSLEQLIGNAISSEEITNPILDRLDIQAGYGRVSSDWIWICLTALWERWFPNKPCFELLDDKIQNGYDLQPARDPVAVCEIWLTAWTEVLRIMDKSGLSSIREFDEQFLGTQSLFNWIQDLVSELWAAARVNPEFLQARISVCREGLRRFTTDDPHSTENRRRALAESYFELGETANAEGLYREWLEADPEWGWAWIDWSDCYRHTQTGLRNAERAEQILREGLSIPGVREREEIAGRLADLLDEQGRSDEAEEFQTYARRRTAAESLHESFNFMSMPRENSAPTVRGPKVGRNEPCPCGSGKKFKKCCGG